MKKILILILSLLSVEGYAQSNYIEYHKKARFIDSLIIDSCYKEAILSYNKLFSNYDFIFAEDCFRAIQTATYIKDTINAFQFLDKGIKQGITMQRILKDSVLIDLKKYHKSWSNFEKKYCNLRETYLASINSELRLNINKLYNLDQKYRDKHELHPWNFLWRPLIWNKWKKITKSIVENELIPLIEQYGFPGEKLIGLDEASFHNKQKNDAINSYYAFIILIHYYSIPRPSSLNSILLREIKKGNISPKQYASIIDFQAQWGKKKYYKGLHYNEWHKSKNIKDLPKINANRIAIGLESLDEKKRKFERALKACDERKKGNYKIIRFWVFCG